MTYKDAYARSLSNRETFWADAAAEMAWDQPWDRVLNDSNPPFYRWFDGARCNTCYNAVDRHVAAGRGDQNAIIYDSAMTGEVRHITFSQLQDHVARLAGVLQGLGVGVGDRVVIYMPMIPEAAMAMLACARIGAIHSVVFGGFAPEELAKRLTDAAPKLVICGSCGLEPGRTIAYKPMVDAAIDLIETKPDHVVVYQRPEVTADLVAGRDVDWAVAMAAATPADCVSVAATDPLYILYTSGTTGMPKGVVRDNGGHMVALNWSMGHVYGMNAGDVFWSASDVGWVVGHSYIVYGPLLRGCTTVMYEGKPVGTPDASAFWRVISQHRVNGMFTAPTAFRAIKREDPTGQMIKDFDISSLRGQFLAGERADPDTVNWAAEILGVPVIDNWWQTETGWPICANYLTDWLSEIKPGSPSKPVPGYEVHILDEAGQPLPAGTQGAIAIKLPLPPGTLPTLWQNDQRYVDSYLSAYEGYYNTGDAGFVDADGYLSVMCRTDDIINVAGHRLSTGAMEEVLSGHAAVAECAVFGVADQLKGQVPVGLVVLKAGITEDPIIVSKELVTRVREHIGAVAALRDVTVVKRLPKTRSGKVLRATMRKIADGETYAVPPTIDDPAVLSEISLSLEQLGFPRPSA